MLARGLSKSVVEIFDLDRTLVSKNTSFSFYLYLFRKGLIARRSALKIIPIFLRYRLRRLSLKGLHEALFKVFVRGIPYAVLSEAAPPFLDLFLPRWLKKDVLERFLEAKKRGAYTVLLSSSPDFLVEPIAKRLGFDLARSTSYAVDKEGKLCKIADLIEGSAKLRIAKELFSACAETVAYSDSIEDLPLLKWAKKAVAVSADSRLKKYARQEGWEVL